MVHCIPKYRLAHAWVVLLFVNRREIRLSNEDDNSSFRTIFSHTNDNTEFNTRSSKRLIYSPTVFPGSHSQVHAVSGLRYVNAMLCQVHAVSTHTDRVTN